MARFEALEALLGLVLIVAGVALVFSIGAALIVAGAVLLAPIAVPVFLRRRG